MLIAAFDDDADEEKPPKQCRLCGCGRNSGSTLEAKSTEFYETNASTALLSSRRVTKGVDETTAAVGGRNFNGEGKIGRPKRVEFNFSWCAD